MNKRLEAMKQRVRDGEHRGLRRSEPISIVEECEAENLSWIQRAARLTVRQCEAETPIIGPDEKIVFTRTLPAAIPPLYPPQTYARITAGRTLHELGPISNICAGWGMVLAQGLLKRRQVALETRSRLAHDAAAVESADCAIQTIDAVLGLAARYAQAARAQGREDVAQILDRVPAHPPRKFREALQSLRLLQAVVWLSGHYHVGLGRFDQYLWPYLQADLAAGRETIASAEDLLAEFFIALNKDSDLYPGVQQGDNGQTLTVGGVRPDGSDGVNELTRMVLRVALATSMIDPKINLRINANTDLDLLCLASELTRAGLGFPQYSNDDLVIPALIAHGYAPEDARDYTVAACWEFIIPGKGMEVVNIGAVSMPAAADRGIREALAAGGDFARVLECTARDIRRQVGALVEAYGRLLLPPAPYYSVLMEGCLESGRDLSLGCKYNNFGVHGAGSADAADSLAAVQKLVFDEQSVAPQELLRALDANYAGYDVLRAQLANRAPKVGRNDAEADALLTQLFDLFATACEEIPDNGRGGRIRPGTGSAMYYVWLARGHEGMREPVVGATANGRRQGDFFGANLAPAHNARAAGPTAVLQSFSHIDYRRVFNGGPITLELSDTVFRDDQAIRKVALLVRAFARMGCQQLQLNTVQLDTLQDARVHPERHRNLIVRVWGWSAYFTDLETEYQEHIIQRQMHTAV
jgi:pyruvate-formate lyase